MKTKVAKLLVLAVVLLSFSGCTLFSPWNDVAEISFKVDGEELKTPEYTLEFGEKVTISVVVKDAFAQELKKCTIKWSIENDAIGTFESNEGYNEGYTVVFNAAAAGEEYIEGKINIAVESSLTGKTHYETLKIIVGTKEVEE